MSSRKEYSKIDKLLHLISRSVQYQKSSIGLRFSKVPELEPGTHFSIEYATSGYD